MLVLSHQHPRPQLLTISLPSGSPSANINHCAKRFSLPADSCPLSAQSGQKCKRTSPPRGIAQLIPHKGVYVLRHFSEPCSDITLYLLTEVTCLVSATSLSRFLLLCWHFLRFSSRHISYTQILFSRSVSRKIPTKILVFKMPSFPQILISLKWGHRNVFGTHIWIATRPVTS